MRLLIVEDEERLNDILKRCLKAEGYTVDGVTTALEAFESVKNFHYDLLIIDLQLPDGSGTGLLKRIREGGYTMPTLILTARSDLESKLENFRAGADDYVVKPVALAELAIRVRALLRRGSALQENIVNAADLEINRLTRQVKRDGRTIQLSAKEYSLLEYLMLNSGRILSRSMIVERIWDQSFENLTNIVDVYIGHLRHKIDEGHEVKLIHTVRGLGYKLDVESRS